MNTATLSEEPVSVALQDGAAVAAVRGGDAQRYRELVERHERRVFAVAWSRLGDATMAQDATQEAFIRAYKYLPMLGDGAKFASWVGSIARNAAISLGMKHRRELERRERWALEQPVSEAAASEEKEEICSPELLRKTLTELSPAHRECLVLFYLEGKSGQETAETLGITEGALRVRLLRARGALREKLESKLGESLEQLRPAHTMVPSIMAVIIVSPGMKAAGGVGAGLGTGLAATFAKFLPLKFVGLLFPMVGLIPTMALTQLTGKLERQNYREADGFRVRAHWLLYRGTLWGFPLMMGAALLFSHGLRQSVGLQGMFLGLGVLSLCSILVFLWRFQIQRNRYNTGMLAYSTFMTVFTLLVGLGVVPALFLGLAIGVSLIFVVMVQRDRPLRMDYNLFLRATEGMLPPVNTDLKSEPACGPFSKREMIQFGRFLGGRWLATCHRWTPEGLWLSLPAAKPTMGRDFAIAHLANYGFGWSSSVLLRWDGTADAHLSERDQTGLKEIRNTTEVDSEQLEIQVVQALEDSWRQFRTGDQNTAARTVGHVTDEEIFITAPSQTKLNRARRTLVIGLVVFALFPLVVPFIMGKWRTKVAAPPPPVKQMAEPAKEK